MMMAQLSSEPEPMPFDVFAQTGTGALMFDGDEQGVKSREFGTALYSMVKQLQDIKKDVKTSKSK